MVGAEEKIQLFLKVLYICKTKKKNSKAKTLNKTKNPLC